MTIEIDLSKVTVALASIGDAATAGARAIAGAARTVMGLYSHMPRRRMKRWGVEASRIRMKVRRADAWRAFARELARPDASAGE